MWNGAQIALLEFSLAKARESSASCRREQVSRTEWQMRMTPFPAGRHLTEGRKKAAAQRPGVEAGLAKDSFSCLDRT
jgi:hypothetical protein